MSDDDPFPGPPFDRAFYEALRAKRQSFDLVRTQPITVADGGGAIRVEAGQVLRITCPEGPQISDVCFWNADNPSERLWNDQTLNQEGLYLTTFSRIWTNMPWYRPLMTIIDDTVVTVSDGPPRSRHHTITAAHCNPHNWFWTFGQSTTHEFVRYNCWSNLVKAIEPFGLRAEDVHDNLNLFQRIGYDPITFQGFSEPSNAVAGDHVDFYAELPSIVAATICPSGSGRLPSTSPVQDRLPLLLEVFDTGVQPLRPIIVKEVLGL